jgi:anti-sigma B factor antagonist
MDIELNRIRQVAVVHCRGRLVFADGAERLRTAAAQALLAGQDVVLDLARVTQMDAHGAGVLAELFGLARRERRRLSLTGASDRVRRVLRVTGLDSVARDIEESGTPGRASLVGNRPWLNVCSAASLL